MSKVVESIPEFELYYASNARAGREQLGGVCPDIVVLDFEEDEMPEHDVFLEELGDCHPPIIVHCSGTVAVPLESPDVYYMGPCETLDGVHKSLLVSTALVERGRISQSGPTV